MADAEYLFLTGFGRSGTTLLEKLLAAHPALSVLPQPFPYLFLEAKRELLAELGCAADPHPLGDYFLESRYGVDDLVRFLAAYRLDAIRVRALFDAMRDYSGQMHRPDDLERRLAAVEGGAWIDVFRQLVWLLRHRESPRLAGSKEIHCEEFLPWLAQCGVRCLLVVRDPRDAISSFAFGRGPQFGGLHRPTLFYVRQWRKSVAFALLLDGHPLVRVVRYEDLVSRPAAVLAELAGFLGVDPFEPAGWRAPLTAQDGRPWPGNSSFLDAPRVTTAAIGQFRRVMPEPMQRYIECTCLPEMRALGYACHSPAADPRQALERFREPRAVERSEFAADDSWRPERVRQELERLRLVQRPGLEGDERLYFLAASVHRRLRAAVAAGGTRTELQTVGMAAESEDR